MPGSPSNPKRLVRNFVRKQGTIRRRTEDEIYAFIAREKNVLKEQAKDIVASYRAADYFILETKGEYVDLFCNPKVTGIGKRNPEPLPDDWKFKPRPRRRPSPPVGSTQTRHNP